MRKEVTYGRANEEEVKDIKWPKKKTVSPELKSRVKEAEEVLKSGGVYKVEASGKHAFRDVASRAGKLLTGIVIERPEWAPRVQSTSVGTPEIGDYKVFIRLNPNEKE